jgi:hypothetical protein
MTNAKIFFAGVGTTFVILALGFGGGLLMARTTLDPHSSDPHTSGLQARAPDRSTPSIRVILPASNEPAAAPQTLLTQAEAPPPQVEQKPSPTDVAEKADTDKAKRREQRKAEDQQRRKRVAERKATREATRIARQQREGKAQPGLLAFGGDEPARQGGFGLFGN